MSKTHREDAFEEIRARMSTIDVVLVPSCGHYSEVRISRSDLYGSFQLSEYGDVLTWELGMRSGRDLSIGSGQGVRSLWENLKGVPYTPALKLYLISQNVVNGYDSFDSAVVRAVSAEKARATHPYEAYYGVYTEDDPWVAGSGVWPNTPDKVEVELIGTASPGAEPGVVCASFNAG